MNYRKINALFPASSVRSNLIRIMLVGIIIAAFGMAISGVDKRDEQVKGDKDEKLEISQEIERTLKVVAMRPDYVAAWVRLSVLYEQAGDNESSKRANENAKKLNPDL